jgi:Right handed beta helix region
MRADRSNSRNRRGRPTPRAAFARAAVAAAILVAFAALPSAASADGGHAFFVATTGSDANPGTKARPWRTIQTAANTVPAGSTVEIRGGVYHERVVVGVSGAPGAWITFRNYDGEHVRLDGTGLGPYDGIAGLVAIDSRAYIALDGLEIAHFHDLADQFVPAGVFVTGTAHHIALRNLDVHDIRTATADAHGIAVYGTSGDSPIHDVTIDGNRVHDNHLGSSESVVVNGNVRGWAITHNHIWRNDNIGIDAIGFEGKAPRNDQARDGYIADNLVTDIDSLGNPAYDEDDGTNCRCADGIYVDGGRDLLIERNVVLRSNIALEIASEHSFGSATNVLARDNLLADSTTIGLAMGGYDTERGQTIDARVVNNTFVNNDTLGTGSGEILLQYRVYDSQILNNIVVANAQAIMIANPYVENAGNLVDGNDWWVVGAPPAKATWQWKNVTYHGFAAYRRATGNDAHSVLGDPLLGAGWRPRPGSPAIDAGLDTPLAGPFDLYGAPRRQARAIDIGAVET